MLAWPVVHWLVFSLYLNIQTVISSFLRWNPYLGVIQNVGFYNYSNFINKIIHNIEDYGIAFRNTFLFIPLTILVLLPISIFVSYILYRKIPMHKLYSSIFFLPSLISIVILTLAWGFMWDPNRGVVNGLLGALGLENLQRTWLGDNSTALLVIFLYCIWAGIGFNNLIISGAINNISKEIFESAKMDGISSVQELIYIIIPSSWPTISTLAIMGTAGAFSMYLQPYLLTGGQYGTTTVALKTVNTVMSGDYGLASASGIAIGVMGFIVTISVKSIIDRGDKKWG